MEGETQPHHRRAAGSPHWGAGNLLAPAGILAEGRKFCRKPELPSPPLPFSAGEAASLVHPSPQLLVRGEPPYAPCAAGLHCVWVLGGHQGIPSPRSFLMPLRTLYVKLCPPGNRENPHVAQPSCLAPCLRRLG